MTRSNKLCSTSGWSTRRSPTSSVSVVSGFKPDLRRWPRYDDGMTCPACGQNVSDSDSSCPSCGVTLSPAAPGPPSDPDIELVSVLRTGDPAELAVVTSLLDSEEIDYFVRGDRTQDLFGAGRVGMGFNLVTGPAEIIVRAEDAARARSLLNNGAGRPADE